MCIRDRINTALKSLKTVKYVKTKNAIYVACIKNRLNIPSHIYCRCVCACVCVWERMPPIQDQFSPGEESRKSTLIILVEKAD